MSEVQATPQIITDDERIERLLNYGTVTVEVRESLVRKLKSGRQLRVKMGFDPSAPDIHIGHAVGMRKLREFQDLGHKVVIIVGDWTAQIGDPSGRSSQRRMLSPEEVRVNAQTYLDQFFMVVDDDPQKIEIAWQSSWFEDFSLADVLHLTSKFTVAQMLTREDFRTRLENETPIGIVEFLYPLLQAYDSVAVRADVEMGGTDQTFNLLVGRDIQREMGQEPQDILTVPILVGLDGVQKMSKSLGNYVGLTDPPNEMYGKLMSIPDSILDDYLLLAAALPDDEIAALRAGLADGSAHPRDVKDRMAASVVARYHSPEAAEAARAEFERVFRERQVPEDIPEFDISYPATVVAMLRRAGFAASNNEARRLVQQGGVRIDGERVSDPDVELSFDGPVVLQAGRRRFARMLPAK
ncbi:MAG TPA: tyrosine--tRNA ligase [Thermomicrobiales bacterium]|nr:tyrosine--tRNA ligase [Thermomicrobiales bacterium]